MWRLCKISITPTICQNHFLLGNILIVGIPKYTVLAIIFKVFMWPISFINEGLRRIIQLKCFGMVSKTTRSSVTCKMDNGIGLSSSDFALTSKKKKNFRATLKIQMRFFYLLKHRMMHSLRLVQNDLPLYQSH